MFIKALIAFVSLPGIFAILLPPLIARLDPCRGPSLSPGIFIIIAGGIILASCIRDFYVTGKGTLAPWAPPEKLVIIGLYRFTRNPMYAGVLLLVAGWCVFFSSLLLVFYLVLLAAGFHLRVVLHEEPFLKSRFGDDWEFYRKSVPRWLPRLNSGSDKA